MRSPASWAGRSACRVRAFLAVRASGVAEEPALQRLQQFVLSERTDLLVDPFFGRDREVVGKRVVRSLERVAELVAFEDVVVGARGGVGTISRIDRSADRPERTRPALDPDDDLLTASVLADSMDDPFGETHPR